jgi:heme-binding uptake protein ChaN (Tiki superfamily)
VSPAARAQRVSRERRAFHRARALIAEWEGRSPTFLRDRTEGAASPARFRAVSSFETLVRRAAEAEITYVGDFHTNPESQRTLLRILRALRPRIAQLGLGTEFVAGRYQEEVDRYLLGKLADRAFLERIRYRELWPYDVWTGMRPVLEYCREAGVAVVALDALGEEGSLDDPLDLEARDSYAAARVAACLSARPELRLLIQFGEHHIASGRLPRAVDRELAARGLQRRPLLISQNAERIYWKLLAAGRQHVRVVEIDRRHFCVLNTRPHRQQETYLEWLEGG